MTRTMWDGVNSDAKSIKSLAKPNDLIAYYIDGAFAWTKQEIALFPNNKHVTITVLGNPADVADCETGDMTPASAANWVRSQKARGYDRPTVYRSLSMMQDVRQTTGTLIMGRDWDAWVADYDNKTSQVYSGSVAKQFKNAAYYDESIVYDDNWPHRTIGSSPVTAPVTAPKWPAGQICKEGAVGHAVVALQQACHNSGMTGVRGITVDGVFGAQTLSAVRNFQKAERLTVDGIAGSNTRSKMMQIGLLNSAGQANS
jgi:peptidoglycan hydrolase-like protein with peptidoglycan-binding domain